MVSVIMASHNKAPVLRETLDSVLGQTLGDWELVVVDDASTDQSWAILGEYASRDDRVRIARMPASSGRPAVPRNRALELARGEWIALMDADDLWHEEKLERQVAAVKQEGVGFCSTAAISFDGIAPRLSGPPEGCGATWVDHERLLRKNVIAASSAFVRADILRDVGFTEDPRLCRVEDAHCWLRIHRDRVDRSVQLGEHLTFYRRGPAWRTKLTMARKRYLLLEGHEVGGRPLGIRTLRYFGTYALSSVLSTIRTGGSFRSA